MIWPVVYSFSLKYVLISPLTYFLIHGLFSVFFSFQILGKVLLMLLISNLIPFYSKYIHTYMIWTIQITVYIYLCIFTYIFKCIEQCLGPYILTCCQCLSLGKEQDWLKGKWKWTFSITWYFSETVCSYHLVLFKNKVYISRKVTIVSILCKDIGSRSYVLYYWALCLSKSF